MKFSFSPTLTASLAAVALIGTTVQVQALEDIPTTAIENGSFTTLVAALGAADLVDALSEPNGPFTVFAPTDEAFDALPNGLVECLLEPENKDSLAAILTYHVVSGQVLSSDLMDGMTATTLQGEDVTVDLSDGVKINDSIVVAADVSATNGVIHVISSVLVPPSLDVEAFLETCGDSSDSSDSSDDIDLDIPGTAIAAGTFNTLVAALGAADLVDALSDPNGPFTVFAPTDDAFAALPEGLVTCLLEPDNKGALSAILTYHVVPFQVLSNALIDGRILTTLQGEEVTVDLSDGVKINESTVETADVLAKNGVIHIIDAVLVPPSIDVVDFLKSCERDGDIDEPTLDIPGTAIAAGVFNTLVAALSAADLVGALSDPNGPFTVFAPSDEAFAALPEELVTCLLEPENKESLAAILTYHVVSGQFLSTELEDGMKATGPTLQGEDVTFSRRNNGDVKVNDSKVVFVDVLTTNGVIQVIDAVLVPPSIDVAAFLETCGDDSDSSDSSDDEPDVCTYLGVSRSAGQYLTGPSHTCLCQSGGHWIECKSNEELLQTTQEFILTSDSFTTLEAAVVQADLVGFLDGDADQPYTLFAPTDAAFANVPAAVLAFLLDNDNKEVLLQVLSYHVLSGIVDADDVPAGTTDNILTLLEPEVIVAKKTCFTATKVETGTPPCDEFSLLLNGNSNVIVTDIETANGIVHVIDTVLIPPSLVEAVAKIVEG